MASNYPLNDQNQPEQEFDVMISYQWDSQEMCKKIKKSLADSGYKVWMDVEQMHGNIFECMANAVQNSRCVLLCVTKKYKNSENCQRVRQIDHCVVVHCKW